MYVDLRPLNRIIQKQKYSFPIIKDHRNKLYDKNIFTSLDLKDGFHQINVDPSCIKYFAFSMPPG